jgi:hypothetical protein
MRGGEGAYQREKWRSTTQARDSLEKDEAVFQKVRALETAEQKLRVPFAIVKAV